MKFLTIILSLFLITSCASNKSTSEVKKQPLVKITDPREDIDPINFDFDSSDLRAKNQSNLSDNADVFKKFHKIVIEGHTDKSGAETYNKDLGQKRADSVKDYLVKEGIMSSKYIKTKSYGETKPLVYGDSENAYQQNRRVEIKFYH